MMFGGQLTIVEGFPSIGVSLTPLWSRFEQREFSPRNIHNRTQQNQIELHVLDPVKEHNTSQTHVRMAVLVARPHPAERKKKHPRTMC